MRKVVLMDSTAQVQALWDAAKAGDGVVHLPAGEHNISHIDATDSEGIIVRGDGPKTRLVVTGSDGGLWWDMTGTRKTHFEHLSVVNDGTNIPRVLFPWLAQDGKPLGEDVTFENVSITAKASDSLVLGFGYRDFRIVDCEFTQLHNGAAQSNADFDKRTGCFKITAQDPGLTSTHQTVATGPTLAWNTRVNNCDFIDDPEGVTAPNLGQNVPFMTVTAGAPLNVTGGSARTMGQACVGIWHFGEGQDYDGMQFVATNGGTHLRNLVAFGGGQIGNVTFRGNLLTQVAVNGAPFVVGPPVIRNGIKTGGVGRLRIEQPDLGAHLPGNHFISVGLGLSCTHITKGMPGWLTDCDIDLFNNTAVACGNCTRTTWRHPKNGTINSIILPPGATDRGRIVV